MFVIECCLLNWRFLYQFFFLITTDINVTWWIIYIGLKIERQRLLINSNDIIHVVLHRPIHPSMYHFEPLYLAIFDAAASF